VSIALQTQPFKNIYAPPMKIASLLIFLFSLALLPCTASPLLNVDRLGEQLGGWDEKGKRAAEYERSGSKYRTWKPEVSAMLDGGIFISMRIDHMRGLFAADDHAAIQITLDESGNIVSAQSSMAFQGRKITSDAIRMTAEAGTSTMGVQQVAKVGTDLMADLSSKLLRENVAEPGRVTFPAVIHHNYNLLCLATGLISEGNIPKNAIETGEEKTAQKSAPQQTDLKVPEKPGETGKTVPLKGTQEGKNN
jgi:hypothetical protein